MANLGRMTSPTMTAQSWRIVLGILIREIAPVVSRAEIDFYNHAANRQLMFYPPSATKIVAILATLVN